MTKGPRGTLMKNGQAIPAGDPEKVLRDFIDWLEDLNGSNRKTVLIAYNGHRFDMPALTRAFQRYQIPYKDCIAGSIDPMKYFKTNGSPNTKLVVRHTLNDMQKQYSMTNFQCIFKGSGRFLWGARQWST